MTTLTASQLIMTGISRPASRLDGIRLLVARMSAAAKAAKARRHLKELPDYLLRDIGLTRADIAGLDP